MSSRLPSLDVLRTIAVLGVFGPHLVGVGGPHTDSRLALAWAIWGWTGVDMFFVLSGFLVSGLLFTELARTGQLRVGRFLFRRGMKIYPAFYVYLAVVMTVLLFQGGLNWWAALNEAIFVQNYRPNLWAAHTWSLAVEEHFYLLLPIALLSLIRATGSLRQLPWAIAGLLVAVLAARLITTMAVPVFDYKIHHFPTHLRIDSLAFGVLLRYWHDFHRSVFVATVLRWRFLLASAAMIAIATPVLVDADGAFMRTFGFTVLYIGYGALLAILVCTGLPKNRVLDVLAKIGSYSYSIYLWHMAVMIWLMPPLVNVLPIWLPFWRFSALYVGVAIAFGMLMSLLIERPALALRDALTPAERPSRTVAPISVGSADPSVTSASASATVSV